MKTSAIATGLFAALASAHYQHPRHFHYRRDNTTASAIDDGSMTTLTVVTTEVHTVTSCAPTITNCPANPSEIENLPETDKQTFVTTSTVALTTTVCPVADVPAISASVIENATNIPGATASEQLPEVTGPPSNVGGDQPSHVVPTNGAPEVTGPPSNEDGHDYGNNGGDSPGNSATSEASPEVSNGPGGDYANGGNQPGNSEEPTTTVTAITTATTTVTVPGQADATSPPLVPENPETPETPVGGEGDESSNPPANGGASNEGAVCEPVTVTVTAPATTVYMTAGNLPSEPADGVVENPAVSAPPATETGEEAEAEDEDDEEDDEECDDDAAVTNNGFHSRPGGHPTQTGSYTGRPTNSPPYPVPTGGNNGTYPQPPMPSGFMRLRR